MQGIGLYTSLHERSFTVEIGVVRHRFFWSLPEDTGSWREFGLRTRLGLVMHPDMHSRERDFVVYHDQSDLEQALRRSLEDALAYGPAEWKRMGRRLLASD